MKLSKYFTLESLLDSKYASINEIVNIPSDLKTIKNLSNLCNNVLDKVYKHYKKRLKITSGYRCEELNEMLGLSKKSQNATGQAIDFKVEGISSLEVCRYIKAALNFDRLVYKGEDLHVSFNEKNNRKQVLKLTDEGYKNGLP